MAATDEQIKNLKETVARYEKMKSDYSDSLTRIEARIDYLLKVKKLLPSSPRVKSLVDAQMSTIFGFRNVCEYLNAIKERLEAAENDPNYDHETWCSGKTKKNR